MVYKKYIKRGEKTFGPYLYENYRENGKTKTRYLGLAKKKKQFNWMFIFGIVLLFMFIIGIIGIVLTEPNFFKSDETLAEGELATVSFLNNFKNIFVTGSPLNVFVQVSNNHPPYFDSLTRPEKILVCEGDSIDRLLIVHDEDGDALDLKYDNLFFGSGIGFGFDPEKTAKGNLSTDISFTSPLLDWKDIERQGRRYLDNGWAIYPERVWVDDGAKSDYFDTNIIIIEVNNKPEFNIPVQTILPENLLYAVGEDNEFSYDLGNYLQNNGEETPISDLIFNLTNSDDSESVFSISNQGVINIIGDESFIEDGQEATTYDLKVCVEDSGMVDTPHEQIISLCVSNGFGSNVSLSFCDEFSLTITNKNRAPNITSYFPNETNFSILGTDILYFNISADDADFTPLDVYWYVENDSKRFYEGLNPENVSEFEYIFGCGISGNYTIKAVVTDGLLNDSVEWNLSVENVACPEPVVTIGGGGGGGGRAVLYCEENWICEEWDQCESLMSLSEIGWTSEEIELIILERCGIFEWSGEFCGFQQRICKDSNFCRTDYKKPGIIQECYYTENPTCNDNIKNCHDGSCEVLIDCGGPCDPCPTCSDGVQNQGEEGIDCGGPCKNECLEYAWVPNTFKMFVSYSLIGLFVLVLFLVFKQIIRYMKSKKMFKESNIKNKIIRGVKEERNVKKVMVSLVFIFLIVGFLFAANMFIMPQTGIRDIIPGGEIGFLASYGAFGSFLRNLGVFFVTGPIINENSGLQIGDDSDDFDRFTYCENYCKEKNKPSENVWHVNFYADYREKDSPYNPISLAEACKIRFEDTNWITMVYNSESELWEYENVFYNKGEYLFEINCTYGFYSNNASEKFIIKNTVPYILQTAQNYLDFDKDGDKNTLFCFEDTDCFFNFTTNVSEDDLNDLDILSFYAVQIGENPLTNFEMNETTGILKVNITHSDFTGENKEVKLIVQDSESEVFAILEVDVQEVNDPPEFADLENKTLSAGDLFTYIIPITDEEENTPYLVNTSINNLFDETNYSVNGDKLTLSFVPENTGEYIINFSVMDNDSELGNATSSQLVNFTVQIPVWTSPLNLIHILNEEEEFYLNLSKNVSGENVIFSNGSAFSNFNITSEGIINFTPDDEDVGSWLVDVFADNGQANSKRVFNFTIQNKNDSVLIDEVRINGEFIEDEASIFENIPITIGLNIEDRDLLITKKGFYYENFSINLTIEGPHPDLFVFDEDFEANTEDWIKPYVAKFTAVDVEDTDIYKIKINISDANNFSSDFKEFDLIINNQAYDFPNITSPIEGYEFNLFENVSSSDLVFNVNHSVEDVDLHYYFYIGDELMDDFMGLGDNGGVDWDFVPDFNSETYGNKTNLTLLVVNPWVNDFNTSRTWNLTIEHTNAPVEFIDNIQDMEFDYKTLRQMDLKDYFLDVDNLDEYYLQNLSFNITSNSSPSYITVSKVLEDWTFRLISSQSSVFNETLIVTAYDLNMTNSSNYLTNISSNYFNVNIVEPEIVQVPVPQPSGGSRSTIPVSLKIISPGEISVFEGEKIEIPIQLINSGKKTFNDLSLNVSAFKDGDASDILEVSLDKDFFDSLKSGQEENLTLDIFFNENKTGKYEVLIQASSKSPKYTDWEKIYINSQKINDSTVQELIIFTEEFIAGNPQCIEIVEIVNDAEEYFENGDYVNAKLKTEQALNACKDAISQVSVPKQRTKSFMISLYLILSVIIALIIGLIYYFIKKRKFQQVNLKQNK